MPPQIAPAIAPASIVLRPARIADILAIHQVRKAAADALTSQFGNGPWSSVSIISTAERALSGRTLFKIVDGSTIIGTLTLTPLRIGFYKPDWFADAAAKALYLHSMSIHPQRQHDDIGRQALEQVEAFAGQQGFTAIRLDSYDSDAGAGGFYESCGFVQVAREDAMKTKLKIYERIIYV
ncbi:MAG: GNAT family N-acetyltransferase [Micavibrio sp.]|nr:GNAT family N-acetyltransferase [Micavibrio sp.]